MLLDGNWKMKLEIAASKPQVLGFLFHREKGAEEGRRSVFSDGHEGVVSGLAASAPTRPPGSLHAGGEVLAGGPQLHQLPLRLPGSLPPLGGFPL